MDIIIFTAASRDQGIFPPVPSNLAFASPSPPCVMSAAGAISENRARALARSAPELLLAALEFRPTGAGMPLGAAVMNDKATWKAAFGLKRGAPGEKIMMQLQSVLAGLLALEGLVVVNLGDAGTDEAPVQDCPQVSSPAPSGKGPTAGSPKKEKEKEKEKLSSATAGCGSQALQLVPYDPVTLKKKKKPTEAVGAHGPLEAEPATTTTPPKTLREAMTMLSPSAAAARSAMEESLSDALWSAQVLLWPYIYFYRLVTKWIPRAMVWLSLGTGLLFVASFVFKPRLAALLCSQLLGWLPALLANALYEFTDELWQSAWGAPSGGFAHGAAAARPPSPASSTSVISTGFAVLTLWLLGQGAAPAGDGQ